MRVNVASIGGGDGGGGCGFARSRSVRYSSTGNTTQPSGVVVWAFTRSALPSAHTTTVVMSSARLIASSSDHSAAICNASRSAFALSGTMPSLVPFGPMPKSDIGYVTSLRTRARCNRLTVSVGATARKNHCFLIVWCFAIHGDGGESSNRWKLQNRELAGQNAAYNHKRPMPMDLTRIFRSRLRDGGRAQAAKARRVERTIELCRALLSERGDVSGARLAAEVVNAYQQLDDGQVECFLDRLVEAFSVDPEAVRRHADAYRLDGSPPNLIALQKAVEPPRQELF